MKVKQILENMIRNEVRKQINENQSKIEIGTKFKTRAGDTWEVIKVSPTALVLKCKLIGVGNSPYTSWSQQAIGVIKSFKYYQASGKYIRTDSTNDSVEKFI